MAELFVTIDNFKLLRGYDNSKTTELFETIDDL